MQLYGEWKVTLPDEEYVWRPDDTTLSDELLLEGEIPDFDFEQWLIDIDARKAIPCQVLVWFLRRQAGQQQERMAVDFPIRRLALQRVEDVDDDPKDDSETPEPSTSESSPAA